MSLYKISLVALFSIILSVSVFSQEKFEGKVVYKITTGDDATEIGYLIKDNFIKMDIQGGERASMIFDTKESKMIILMPDEKMFMEMPVDMNLEQMKQNKDMKGEFKETGETKDILGYKSEKWTYKDEKTEVEAWLTKELGSFMFMANPMEQRYNKPDWQVKLEKGGYFPLSVIVKEGTGGEKKTRMDVTSVEKKSFDKEMFAPPAGYQKLDMPGMK